ncbi:exonuclease 1 [Sabethes cyaneus]|uniref:exonuclease 1 n=1 Tax=Sabethes cyaneus TaxID=53552 RepID=UPI00237E4E7C|nr:exonuclease 1 [Sabethes cyaneus]
MGITGLIPFLEKASSQFHLRDLRGQCVAIDSYCWLHKGAFACADKLARGEPTDVHIQYCLKYVNLLLSHDIKPILVFDGRHLPAKAATEAKRRESRNSSKKRAAELLRDGRIDEARSFLRRCVDITHGMALQLIQECRKRNVDCVVAPYEADAQLAFLNKKGIAQAVITEDSDLMLFGCSKVLFKLDLNGQGMMIEADKLYLAMGCKEEKYSFDKFRYMCILSGCDYMDSLPGIGLAKARKFVLLTEETDVRKALAKIPAYLNMRHLEVTDEYKMDFLKADATFKHMVVYDPTKREQTRLNDPEEMGTDSELCCNAGSFLDEGTALQLALGNLDPFSMKSMDDWHPDHEGCQPTGGKTMSWKQSSIAKHTSVWKPNYQTRRPSSESIRENLIIKNHFKAAETHAKRPVPNPDFENAEKHETIDDLLNAYGIKSKNEQPPLKKLCLTTASVSSISFADSTQVLENMPSFECSPSKLHSRRNPFQISSTDSTSIRSRDSRSEVLSPTKLTIENSSLLRNVSPVKKIEFSASSTSYSIQATSSKTNKLSRFKRATVTNVDDGQKVISRFFSTSIATSETISEECNQDGTVDATSVYLLSPEAKLHQRGDSTPKKQKPLSGLVERLYSPDPPTKRFDQCTEAVDNGFIEEPEQGFSSSQKENEITVKDEVTNGKTSRLQLFSKQDPIRLTENVTSASVTVAQDAKQPESTDDLAIVIEDEEETDKPDPTTRGVQLSRQNSKPSSRRVGLAKGKRVKDVGPTQSKLSMFGFQKKYVIQQ